MAANKKRSNSVDQHVAQRIRARRQELGVTQVALATKLGITFQQVQKYEKGANRISAGRLYRLSEIFGVEPGFFFEGLPRSNRR
jgi:transcriptional regulator with XRE-family HTH domain